MGLEISSERKIYFEQETTIKDIDNEYYYRRKNIRVTKFRCSPPLGGTTNQLILLPSNPDYVDIRQQLVEEKTFKIKIDPDFLNEYIGIIEKISPTIERTVTSKVRGILSVKTELYEYIELYEIVVENFNDRLICDDNIKSKIISGKSYKFTYIKDFGDSKYRILKVEDCLNSIDK